MVRKKKRIALLLSMMLILVMMVACGGQTEAPEDETGPAEIQGSILLATTTSTQDSGLLDVLLPQFTYDTGWEADVLLVHSPAAERDFVAAGHGPERYDVMYNDFVIIGPSEDPATLATDAPDDAVAALKILADKKIPFISRGDESGTHKKELTLWKEAGIEPAGDWYVEAGQGMGAVITMANDMLAYTLSDRATWLNYAADTDLAIVTEGDTKLFNQYGVILPKMIKSMQRGLLHSKPG